MKMNIVVLIIISLFLNQACGNKENNCHETIIFENRTSRTLYVTSSYLYPDTSTFAGIPNPVLAPTNTKIFPNESNTSVFWGNDCIELAYKDLIPSDTMMIYIFDAEVLETEEWSDVIHDYKVLIRYDLSQNDLKYLDWKVTYPPTEAMKDMKMYPSYGQ